VLATHDHRGAGISAYGVLAGEQDPANERIYNCTGMVEKPKFEDAPSKQAIIGRYVLTPRIFELLEQTKPRRGRRDTTYRRHQGAAQGREGLRLYL
jgi:UTP--glucose-1-phosphate uridylyltransferase